MKKQTKQILWLSILLGIAFLFWCGYLKRSRAMAEDNKSISIVVYDSDTERWGSLKEGAETAAQEYDAEIHLLTISGETSWQEQIKLFERELKNGTDAFLVAASDSQALSSFFEENEFPYPIQMIETGLSSEDEDTIEVNNYQMGEELANRLLQEEDNEAKIAVIVENEQRESVVSRYQGFMDTMNKNHVDVVIWQRGEGEEQIQTKLLLQKMLTQEAVDVMAALDNSTLEAAVDAVTNLNKEIAVYGVGNSDQAVNALDNGICKALAYQDEFSMGYLGVLALLDKKTETKSPQYQIVTRETMYLSENEKMLFPFVK